MSSSFASAESPKFTSMEYLAVSLSLPHKAPSETIDVERPAGLPINALPGWESIPLHSKLPMLKCPDNQVIFSKNKVGRTDDSTQKDFDNVCVGVKMDYNPLHDPHLKRFYSNEKLLKRLRDNGEITKNNDVICTLKEFNEYRLPLREGYISQLRIEKRRISEEKRDRSLIKHAEIIAEKERNLIAKFNGVAPIEIILARKAQLGKLRIQRNQVIMENYRAKMQQIAEAKAIQRVVMEHKAKLHNYIIAQHKAIAYDIQRKRLIALKKKQKFKWEKLKILQITYEESVRAAAKEKAQLLWDMSLNNRLLNHERQKYIESKIRQRTAEWIKAHIAAYKRRWKRIENNLKGGSCKKKKKKVFKEMQEEVIAKVQDALEKSTMGGVTNLSPEDIHDALNTVIDLQSAEERGDLSHMEASLFNTAKYIIEHILANFTQDLSSNEYIAFVLMNRIKKLFQEVKSYVIQKATTITAAIADKENVGGMRISVDKVVSFNSFSALIGRGSYEVNSDLKLTVERAPTPGGSLDSITVLEKTSEQISEVNEESRKLNREECIFIEHLFIKFKRQLLVGVAKQVLFAIECHKKNKILDVNPEFKDVDKNLLAKLMARSILSYAVNSYNFTANSKLCQQALAGEVIILLQETIIRPVRDPRRISQPRARCLCPIPTIFPPLCKYMNF